ncbi:MAG: CIA30 family protein [Elusimicrobia bacterium]|nr:CIA30 family protein [Elusimicrobiota bacterium]
MKKILLVIITFNFLIIFPALSNTEIIDDMDIVIGWSEEGDAAVKYLMAVSGGSMLLYYDFSSGTWAQTVKDVSLYDISGGDSLRFWYRGSGNNNNLLITLIDSDGDRWYKQFNGVTAASVWTEQILPFSDLSLAATGNGDFNTYQVYEIAFAVVPGEGGSGTLEIDRLELYRKNALDPTDILLDDFEGGPASTKNKLGGSFGDWGNGGSTITATYDNTAGNVYSGSYSLKLEYTNLGSYESGYWSTPNGVDITTATHLQFYVKSSNDNEAFSIALGSSTSTEQVVRIWGIGTTWEKISIPLRYYDQISNEELQEIRTFVIYLIENVCRGSGKIWFDDIRFVRSATSEGVIKVIDDIDKPVTHTSWGVYADSNAQGSLSQIAGYDGYALRLSYIFNSGNLVHMARLFYPNMSLSNSLRLKYAGDNAINDLEIHVLDSDNTHFWKKYTSVTDTDDEWQTLTIPFSDFGLYGSETGDDSILDLKKIKYIRLTVSKSGGGNGYVIFDDLEYLVNPTVALAGGKGILDNISFDNNPFSPNSDGIEDTITFSFKLLKDASVKLKIYSNNGRVIQELGSEELLSAGEHSLVWTGNDKDERTARNGIYFFQIRAESADGENDRYTNVVGVLR